MVKLVMEDQVLLPMDSMVVEVVILLDYPKINLKIGVMLDGIMVFRWMEINTKLSAHFLIDNGRNISIETSFSRYTKRC